VPEKPPEDVIKEVPIETETQPEGDKLQVEKEDEKDQVATVPITAESQLAEVSAAMVCADHFLGLLNFERAADKLEEQLVALSADGAPHKNTDLHVNVLQKYSSILWWDGDAEGGIDALTAADEILAARQDAGVTIKRRRSELWSQLAQIYRSCGDLDTADEHLSKAVLALSDMVHVEKSKFMDDLREAQAALGQVCVEKKEYDRAEDLYLNAFVNPSEFDTSGQVATSSS